MSQNSSIFVDANTDKRIKAAAALIGYPRASLLFVIEFAIHFENHSASGIDEETLCWRLHDRAIRLHGPNARNQLSKWGIESTFDFGKIVKGLIEHELLIASDADQLVDFENLFDFDDHFTQPKFVEPATTSRRRPSQWDIATLLLLTALAAIGAAGFSRGGMPGAMKAVLSSWLLILGVACIAFGVTDRKFARLFLIAVGICFFIVGMFLYYAFP